MRRTIPQQGELADWDIVAKAIAPSAARRTVCRCVPCAIAVPSRSWWELSIAIYLYAIRPASFYKLSPYIAFYIVTIYNAVYIYT